MPLDRQDTPSQDLRNIDPEWGKGQEAPAPFEKKWCLEFSRLRKLNEKTLFELKKNVNADIEGIRNFFIVSGDTDSPLEVEVLEDFCRGTSLEDVKAGRSRAGFQRVVWIDERNCFPDLEGRGDARQHENPLTATGLFRALEKSRFDHMDLPDAARRLIYITDLDPTCIQALAATVSCHQARVLRNAIYQYLKFQTSIAVKIPSTGFLAFQLDLHLPFFILRKSAPPENSRKEINIKPQRHWTDLSFLKLDKFDLQPQELMEVWGIQEAQISCVVAGSDHWRWVGYGFVDAEIDGILAESSDEDLFQDQIAAGELESNFPIWRPRDYWIRVFEIRSDYVRNQWDYLIHKLELGINQYMKEHSSTLSHRSGNARERAAEMKESFNWALKTMDLLRLLDGVLCDTVEAWKSFNSPDEDLGYFGDVSPSAHRSLYAIKVIFRQLQRSQRRIFLLKNCCSEFSRALELHLNLEAKEAAVENGVTSEFTVAILYPIALAAAIFSMQPGAIPFDSTPRSFALAVFILIALVYAIRLIGRHAQPRWPLLQNPIALWLKRKKLDEDVNKVSKNTFGDTFAQPAGIGFERIIDEGKNDPRSNDTKTCGTRAVCRPPEYRAAKVDGEQVQGIMNS